MALQQLPTVLNAVAALLLLALIVIRPLWVTALRQRHDAFRQYDQERKRLQESLLTAMSTLNMAWDMWLNPTPPETTPPQDSFAKRGKVVYEAVKQQVALQLPRLLNATSSLFPSRGNTQSAEHNLLQLDHESLLDRINEGLAHSWRRQDDIDKQYSKLEGKQRLANGLELLLPTIVSLLIIVATVLQSSPKS